MKKEIGFASIIMGIGLFGLGISYLLQEDYIESESIEDMTEDDFDRIKRSADTVNPIL